jgi:hypothetical protein
MTGCSKKSAVLLLRSGQMQHPHPDANHPAAGPDPEIYGERRAELAAMYPGLLHDNPAATSDLVTDQLFGHK